MGKNDFGAIAFTGESVDQILKRVSEHVKEFNGRSLTVVTPNIFHFLLAKRNPSFASAVNNADIVIPDGWPVALSLNALRGYKGGRIAGSDLSLDVLRLAEEQGMSVGILGGTDESLSAAYGNVRMMHPKLKLVRMTGNPMLPESPTDESTRELIGILNDSRCDVLLLCFGAPKSEAHLDAIKDQINCKVVLCVGATVDFLAGTVQRAPRWVQSTGLEWAYRLRQEPKRLWKRYFESGLNFASVVFLEVLSGFQSRQMHVQKGQK